MNPEDMVMGLEQEFVPIGFYPDGKMVAEETLLHLAAVISGVGRHQFDNKVSGRIYRDLLQLFLEAATPECAGPDAPRQLALYMRVMDEILRERLRQGLEELTDSFYNQVKFHLLKGSTDWRGNWCGAHLNMRVMKGIDLYAVIQRLLPYLTTKIIWAGRGGIEPDRMVSQDSPRVNFVLSPRAFAIKNLISEVATAGRGFIATKNFSKTTSDDLEGFRRIEIISDDSIFSDYVRWVDGGVTALILRLIMRRGFPASFPGFPYQPGEREKEKILEAYHALSRDPTLSALIPLANARPKTALEIQRLYLELIEESAERLSLTPEDRKVLNAFAAILDALASDPLRLADRCDLWFQRKFFSKFLNRYNASWDNCHTISVTCGKKTASLSSEILTLSYKIIALDDDWAIWPKAIAAGAIKPLFSERQVGLAKEIPPFSRARVRDKIFILAEKYGLDVRMRPNSWSVMQYHDGTADYKKLIEMPDPTARGYEQIVAEAEKIIREIVNERAGGKSPAAPPSEPTDAP